MSEHKKRAELREECTDPINFTCGKCHRVVPFKEGYKCIWCDIEPVPEVPEVPAAGA